MTNLSQLTKDDLENLIEQKIREILGRPGHLSGPETGIQG